MRTVKLLRHCPCCCFCLTTLNQSLHADSQTVWKNLQFTSCGAVNANSFPEADATQSSPSLYCSSSNLSQAISEPWELEAFCKMDAQLFQIS